MTDQELIAVAAACVLAAVHVLGGRMRFLGGVPRSAWLSAFGGISVAYVFLHLLPELAEGQETVEGGAAGEAEAILTFLEDHVYVMALVGLIVFYAVDQHSRASRGARGDATGTGAFWLSMASFAVYNAIVGYLLLRGELAEVSGIALYTFALGVHFVVNDVGLREHHQRRYDRVGRWVIAAAVLVGCAFGELVDIPERAIALTIAFIAGGVVLNVLKEELPGERQARLLPFIAGAVLYSVVLQVA